MQANGSAGAQQLGTPRLTSLDHEGVWGGVEMQPAPGYRPVSDSHQQQDYQQQQQQQWEQQQEQQQDRHTGRRGDRERLMAGQASSSAYDPGED